MYARYVPSGHLVYARAGELLAVPFDLKRLEVTGPPAPILKGVSMHPLTGAAQFSLSGDGSLAYVAGGSSISERTLVWVDRKGAVRPLPAPPGPYFWPRVSPDGQRVVVSFLVTNPGLWVYELARGILTRLVESEVVTRSTWTPDGKHVTMCLLSPQSGAPNLYWMLADGSGAAERLTTSENSQVPGSWSPDGQVLAFTEADPTTGFDIWMLGLQGDRKPRPFLQTPANEGGPAFSPDGHWVAYLSDESGRQEIYVRPFPGPGGKWQISSEGDTEPMWARNGRELFYRNGDKMMVTAVGTQPVTIGNHRSGIRKAPTPASRVGAWNALPHGQARGRQLQVPARQLTRGRFHRVSPPSGNAALIFANNLPFSFVSSLDNSHDAELWESSWAFA